MMRTVLVAFFVAILLDYIQWSLFFRANPTAVNPTPPRPAASLQILTDSASGCQYVTTPSGGVAPRVGSDRRQLGCGVAR